jgi:hypothetical protein
MKPIILFFVITVLSGAAAFIIACDSDHHSSDYDEEKAECDARDSSYYQNCDSLCSKVSDSCKTECDPVLSENIDAVCEQGWIGYTPLSPEYTDFCDCLSDCADGWLTCVNDCYEPCASIIV